MIKLTRISDGKTYLCDKNKTHSDSETSEQDANVIRELREFVTFIKENNVIEKLDEIIRRYS